MRTFATRLLPAVLLGASAASFAQPASEPSLLSRLQDCERLEAGARAGCIERAVGSAPAEAPPQSVCYGKVNGGRVENAVSLPREGANFARMAQGPMTAGRVYVHTLVRDILLDAFKALETARPGLRWVYGETGLPQGGPIPPHQTHQNGLSVDLFVPVLDATTGRSAPFPNRADNAWGYGIDFDANGRNATHAIDYEALADLLYHLQVAAAARGSSLTLVVFERELRPALFRTARGAWLRANLPFPNWDDRVRHDDHIHVDFAAQCR